MKDLLSCIDTLIGELTVASRRGRVTRRGEREPIPDVVRLGVRMRDGYGCLWCKYRRDLVMDHIIPWSAGGSDDATNLRLLCKYCNEDRSNYRFTDVAPRLPLVFDCTRCELDDDADGLTPVFCVTCRRHGRSDAGSVADFRRRAAA